MQIIIEYHGYSILLNLGSRDGLKLSVKHRSTKLFRPSEYTNMV